MISSVVAGRRAACARDRVMYQLCFASLISRRVFELHLVPVFYIAPESISHAPVPRRPQVPFRTRFLYST